MIIDDETYVAAHNGTIDLVQYEIKRLIVWHPMLSELLKSTDSLRLKFEQTTCKILKSSV